MPEATLNTAMIFKAIFRVISVFGIWGWVDLVGSFILLFGCFGELWMLLNKLPKHNERRVSLKGCWAFLDLTESIIRRIGVRLKIILPRRLPDLKEHLLEGFFISLVLIGVGMELCALPFSLVESAKLSSDAESDQVLVKRLGVQIIDTSNVVAQAGERIAIAEKDSAEANERASSNEVQVAELTSNNIALQLKLQPRVITLTQMTNFIFLTEKIPKIPIKIAYPYGRQETVNYACQIRDEFNQAGYFPETNSGVWGIDPDTSALIRRSKRADTNWPDVVFFVYGTNDTFTVQNFHYEFTNGFARPIVTETNKEMIGSAIMFALNQIGFKTEEASDLNWVKPGEIEFFIMDRAN
jgi:hypothetical protein